MSAILQRGRRWTDREDRNSHQYKGGEQKRLRHQSGNRSRCTRQVSNQLGDVVSGQLGCAKFNASGTVRTVASKLGFDCKHCG